MLNSFESLTGLPEITGYIFVFILGACIGSFLNVVIYRVPDEKSLLPGSACPNCGKGIAFYHNIPIFGWLMLRGRCSLCSEPISWRYPAVEFLTALVFVMTAWQLGWTVFLPVALVFVSTMIALIFIDADHMILPNVITYPLLIFALLVRLVLPLACGYVFVDTTYSPINQLADQPAWLVSLAGAVMGALVGGGSLWLVGEIWKRLRGVEAMGLGDVKMMFAVGALLGWRLTLLTIFLGAFVGALIGIVLVLRTKKKDFQAQLPFGIFLGLASIIALLFGDRIVNWYLGQFIF
jgi:leader peptidase (prepilin peptidase)/N-methyltransferase